MSANDPVVTQALAGLPEATQRVKGIPTMLKRSNGAPARWSLRGSVGLRSPAVTQTRGAMKPLR
jgi:hypothetical protein